MKQRKVIYEQMNFGSLSNPSIWRWKDAIFQIPVDSDLLKLYFTLSAKLSIQYLFPFYFTVEIHQKPEGQHSLSMRIYSMRRMHAITCRALTFVIVIWLCCTTNRIRHLSGWMWIKSRKNWITSNPNTTSTPMKSTNKHNCPDFPRC